MQETSTHPVTCRAEASTGWITIQRPPLNILDAETVAALEHALDEMEARTDMTGVVLRAAGEKAFSAGVSIQEHLPEVVSDTLRAFHRLIRKIRAFPVPTIAVVQGLALGGGSELATACDLVIAAENARLGQPEIAVGCFPPAACVLLPELVGPQRAAEMILLGRPLSAAEAHRIGIVNRVVPAADLEAAGREMAGQLAAHSSAVLRLTRQALRRPAGLSFEEALDRVEHLYLQDLMRTTDAVEGLQAFLEKRKPTWKGA